MSPAGLGTWLPRCRFPPAGTPVAAAVSGGADSSALLVLAAAAGLEVTAWHVDHGARPGGDAEAERVAALAARVGAGFRSARTTVAPGPGFEARARRARYALLPVGVLTGHTADDLAETVLLNLLRGSGASGLAPMRPAPGRPGRPLLDLRRADTEAVCAVAGVEPFVDPTNGDPRHRRNRVRAEVLGVLGDVAGRDPVPLLARTAALVGDDAALLDELAARLDPTDARSLAAAPVPLARRAVRAWLRASGDDEAHPPSAAEVARVLDVAAGRAVACEVSGGRRVARSGGRLSLRRPEG